MSTPPRQPYFISARCLGPIMFLDAQLSNKQQNLIFARNGTGKSFLSRALRYLDLHGQQEDISHAPTRLVSDEASGGQGAFALKLGENELGRLDLQRNSGQVSAHIAENTIFHVFNDEYVHEQLRERSYNIDGNIEHEIAVDRENIRLNEAREAVSAATRDQSNAYEVLKLNYNTEKDTELRNKANINKQLREYKELNLDRLLSKHNSKPNPPEKTLVALIAELDKLKSLPSNPVFPSEVTLRSIEWIDFDVLGQSLLKITSPSTVADAVKTKIEAHPDFYEIGTRIITDEHRQACPMCEQDIQHGDPRDVIDAYISYFADEEQRHKQELREFYKRLEAAEKEIRRVEHEISKQRKAFDDLKTFVPSLKDTALSDCVDEIEKAGDAVSAYQSLITDKANTLSIPSSLPDCDFSDAFRALLNTIRANNQKAETLKTTVESSDEERRSLQRKACRVFDVEFVISHWQAITELRQFQKNTREKEIELAELERSSPSTQAKDRVADTLEMLLRAFFGDKYRFDRQRFVLTRGANEMARGANHTLSDGEKTAIAFCYFVACIHLKVRTNSDYLKLFLVFDDPVTSMSFDFVYSIAQTLKNMSVSRSGGIAIDPSIIDGSRCIRPRLFVLTHSSYFFNISVTNRVVEDVATFSLSDQGANHTVSKLVRYVAPFQQQLKDVYDIAEGRKVPDHSTGSAVRSVLEAVGRFCRPDKTDSLTNFITFLAGESGIQLQSVLINSLSHGTFFDESPQPDDLCLACRETIQVVEKFAQGQIEVVKKL